MWRSLFVLLFVAVSVGHAAETTGEERKYEADLNTTCGQHISALHNERKKCIFTFIKHLKYDTADSDGNCTNLDTMETNFSVGLLNNSDCWNHEVITSMKTRIRILRRLLNATKENDQFKDFFSNGFKCILAHKTDLDICLLKYMKADTIYKDNLSRVTPLLYYGKTSCSKSSGTIDCAMEIINNTTNKQCLESKVRDFVPFLRNIIINGQCNRTKTKTTSPVKSGSSARIIIGVLFGIVALIIVGLLVIKKYNKRSLQLQQTESYRVSYQHQVKEK